MAKLFGLELQYLKEGNFWDTLLHHEIMSVMDIDSKDILTSYGSEKKSGHNVLISIHISGLNYASREEAFRPAQSQNDAVLISPVK